MSEQKPCTNKEWVEFLETANRFDRKEILKWAENLAKLNVVLDDLRDEGRRGNILQLAGITKVGHVLAIAKHLQKWGLPSSTNKQFEQTTPNSTPTQLPASVATCKSCNTNLLEGESLDLCWVCKKQTCPTCSPAQIQFPDSTIDRPPFPQMQSVCQDCRVKVKPKWPRDLQKTTNAQSCATCSSSFSFDKTRRYRCMICAAIVCSSCYRLKCLDIPDYKDHPQQICKKCWTF